MTTNEKRYQLYLKRAALQAYTYALDWEIDELEDRRRVVGREDEQDCFEKTMKSLDRDES